MLRGMAMCLVGDGVKMTEGTCKRLKKEVEAIDSHALRLQEPRVQDKDRVQVLCIFDGSP